MEAKRSKKAKAPRFFLGLVFVMLTLYAVSLLLPFVWGLMASLKSIDEFRLNILGIPKEWAFSNYPFVFSQLKMPVTYANGETAYYTVPYLLINSLIYVLGCAFLTTLVPCLMAYLNVKFKYRLNKVIYTIVLVTMILPIVGSLPSEIKVLKNLRLYDSIIGILIMRSHFLGFYFLIFYAGFRTMPKEFAEAAYADGCSEWSLMVKIAFPLVRNTFFIVMLIRGIEFWNDYQAPMLYIPSWPTLATGIFWMSQTNLNALSRVPMRLAASYMLMVPVLVLFVVFQNKLIGNLSMGGIKE